MEKEIDHYKIKVRSFSAELDGPLDPNLRTIVQTEVEIDETALKDNGDGTFDQIYRSGVVGATECKQGGLIVKGKSKRSLSQKWRNNVFRRNPDEEYYERIMSKMLANPDKTLDFIESL